MNVTDEALRRARERALRRANPPGWPLRRPSVDREQRQPEEAEA